MPSVFIEIGELDQEITIQQDVGTLRNAAGEHVESWENFFETAKVTRWASIRQLRGWEVDKAQQMQVYATHLITMRWFAGCEALKMRAVHGSRIYYFGSVDDVENKHVKLEILAAERIA